MILVIGALSDSGIGYLVGQLVDRCAPFLLLDPRQHGDRYDLCWTCQGRDIDGRLRYEGQTVPLAEVRSAYTHCLYALPPGETGPGRHKAADTHWLLYTFVENAPFLVVNRPSAWTSNISKPYQQQLIAAAGFRVPRTLLTNSPDEARTFYERCRRRVIYKSVSCHRSIVVRLMDADLGRLDEVRSCTTQFQEWVPGTDVRVHVIGKRLFATEISTAAVDYRYARRFGQQRSMRPVELPPAVARSCHDLAASLRLVATGIDLRLSPEGEYYCFEANPTPAYAFYQQYTGQRMGEALVDVLMRGAA